MDRTSIRESHRFFHELGHVDLIDDDPLLIRRADEDPVGLASFR